MDAGERGKDQPRVLPLERTGRAACRAFRVYILSSGITRQNLAYGYDANGNVTSVQDTVAGETLTYAYDVLDRLTGVSGAYSESYTYNSTTGNLASKGRADPDLWRVQPPACSHRHGQQYLHLRPQWEHADAEDFWRDLHPGLRRRGHGW